MLAEYVINVVKDYTNRWHEIIKQLLTLDTNVTKKSQQISIAQLH